MPAHEKNTLEAVNLLPHFCYSLLIFKEFDRSKTDQQQSSFERNTRLRSASDGDKRIPISAKSNGTENGVLADENHLKQKVTEMSDDVSSRVVTFQISMSSLMLFSAGNKQLLLEKKIREISYCTKVSTTLKLLYMRWSFLA